MCLLQIFLCLVVLIGSGNVVCGQSKPKKPTKSKPITAVVTVKADPPIKPLPKEIDESSWTEFHSKENGLTILFPGSKDDVFDGAAGSVQTFDVSTEKAHYVLAVREIGKPIFDSDLQAYLDATIDRAFGTDLTKFLYRRAISFEGRPGREFGHLDGGKRLVARLYVLNGKLFITSVTMKSEHYAPDFDRWINKFLDSFKVTVTRPEA